MNAGMKTCGFCGKSAQGNYSCHRDGPNRGPLVPLCDVCGGGKPGDPDFLPLERVWEKTSTYVCFPFEAARKVAEGYAERWPEDAPMSVDFERAARWLVGLAASWANSTMITRVYPDLTFDDLADQVASSEELQSVVSTTYQAGAHPFAVLSMVLERQSLCRTES